MHFINVLQAGFNFMQINTLVLSFPNVKLPESLQILKLFWQLINLFNMENPLFSSKCGFGYEFFFYGYMCLPVFAFMLLMVKFIVDLVDLWKFQTRQRVAKDVSRMHKRVQKYSKARQTGRCCSFRAMRTRFCLFEERCLIGFLKHFHRVFKLDLCGCIVGPPFGSFFPRRCKTIYFCLSSLCCCSCFSNNRHDEPSTCCGRSLHGGCSCTMFGCESWPSTFINLLALTVALGVPFLGPTAAYVDAGVERARDQPLMALAAVVCCV
jgi:hypothetical protein